MWGKIPLVWKKGVCLFSFLIIVLHLFVSPAGLDGETGQPSLWRRLREFEKSLSQTALVLGDGETDHVKRLDELQANGFVVLHITFVKKKCVFR